MERVELPTFTVPTYKSCSLILTFDDIKDILGSKPRIVQIGIGELERSEHLVSLGVNWLFSPIGWPVMASGFNPGIPEPEQTFQYEIEKKRIQVSSGIARTSKTHAEFLASAQRMTQPEISIVSLPCEEEGGTVPSAENGKEANKSKLKRKIARRNQCFADSLIALTDGAKEDLAVVVPLIGDQQPMENVNDLKHVVGFTGRAERFTEQSLHKRFVQIRNVGEPSVILRSVVEALEAKLDVVETDFPFYAAKRGLLLNDTFELEDLKDSAMFHNNDLLLALEKAPIAVLQAAAHTKSYIHHLFRCEELSGPILLATVNLFQFERLFQQYRVSSA